MLCSPWPRSIHGWVTFLLSNIPWEVNKEILPASFRWSGIVFRVQTHNQSKQAKRSKQNQVNNWNKEEAGLWVGCKDGNCKKFGLDKAERLKVFSGCSGCGLRDGRALEDLRKKIWRAEGLDLRRGAARAQTPTIFGWWGLDQSPPPLDGKASGTEGPRVVCLSNRPQWGGSWTHDTGSTGLTLAEQGEGQEKAQLSGPQPVRVLGAGRQWSKCVSSLVGEVQRVRQTGSGARRAG